MFQRIPYFVIPLVAYFCMVCIALGMAQDDGTTLDAIVIEGHAILPSHTPAGVLWILVTGVDGTPYGWGTSALDGSFTLEARVPAGTSLVFVHAVDPEYPEAMAVARVMLPSAAPVTAQFQDRVDTRSTHEAERLTGVAVNAQSTSEVAVLHATGQGNTPMGTLSTPQELEAAAQIAQAQQEAFIPQCSVAASPAVTDALQSVMPVDPSSVQARFDRFVAGEGSLLERVKAGQTHISDTLYSSNDMGESLTGGLYFGAVYKVAQTRKAIAAATPLKGNGFGVSVLSLSDLEKAVQIIMTSGWGNCREEGLAGAYLASRFGAFKQIVVVGINVGGFFASHALAIACREDASVYNLAFYGDPLNDQPMAPTDMLAASCIVIDPWLGETATFTREYVEAQKWQSVAATPTLIQLTEATTNENMRIEDVQHEELVCTGSDPALGSCAVCSGPGAEPLEHLCQPFDVSQPPSAWVRVNTKPNPHKGPLSDDTPRLSSACTPGETSLSINHSRRSSNTTTVDVTFTFAFDPLPKVVGVGELVDVPMRLTVAGDHISENAGASAGFLGYRDSLSVVSCSLAGCGGNADAMPEQFGTSRILFPGTPLDPSRNFEFDAFLSDTTSLSTNCRTRYTYGFIQAN